MDSPASPLAPHLHCSFLRNGTCVNPRDYVEGLPRRPRRATAADQRATCDNFWTPGWGAWNGGDRRRPARGTTHLHRDEPTLRLPDVTDVSDRPLSRSLSAV